MNDRYLVIHEYTCPTCEGTGRIYNEDWREANRAYDAARDAAPKPTLDMDEAQYYVTRTNANDAGWAAMTDFWRERGYYTQSRWPPEEYDCLECEGIGTIRREVPLSEALAQIGGEL